MQLGTQIDGLSRGDLGWNLRQIGDASTSLFLPGIAELCVTLQRQARMNNATPRCCLLVICADNLLQRLGSQALSKAKQAE